MPLDSHFQNQLDAIVALRAAESAADAEVARLANISRNAQQIQNEKAQRIMLAESKVPVTPEELELAEKEKARILAIAKAAIRPRPARRCPSSRPARIRWST